MLWPLSRYSLHNCSLEHMSHRPNNPQRKEMKKNKSKTNIYKKVKTKKNVFGQSKFCSESCGEKEKDEGFLKVYMLLLCPPEGEGVTFDLIYGFHFE